MWTSTLFFAPHSLQILVSALLAPGTQWSQQPSVRLPAAWTPLTYGPVMTAAEPRAAVLRTSRREKRERAIGCPPGMIVVFLIVKRNDTLVLLSRLVILKTDRH